MAERKVTIAMILKDLFSPNAKKISDSTEDLNKDLATLKTTTGGASKGVDTLKGKLAKLDPVAKKTVATTNKVGKSFSDLKTNIGGLAGKFSALAIAFTGLKLSRLAADAEETESKFEAVFKSLSSDVKVFSETLAREVGRSAIALRGYLSTFQDTFVPLGFARDEAAELSKSLVTLAIDVASFSNKLEADVIRDFQSTLVGNTETVRKYGIVITEAQIKQDAFNQGLDPKNLTPIQKAQLRYEIILRSTVDAQGDAIRTLDSFTNSTKAMLAVLKDVGIALGELINNELKPFVIAIRDSTAGIIEWVELNKNTISTLLQLGAAITAAVIAYKGFLILKPLGALIIALGTQIASSVATFAISTRGLISNTRAVIANAAARKAAATVGIGDSFASTVAANADALKTARGGAGSLGTAFAGASIKVSKLGGALKTVSKFAGRAGLIGVAIAAFDLGVNVIAARKGVVALNKALADTDTPLEDLKKQTQAVKQEFEDIDENILLGWLSGVNGVRDGIEQLENDLIDLDVRIEEEKTRLDRTIKSLEIAANSTTTLAKTKERLRHEIAALKIILDTETDAAKRNELAIRATDAQLQDYLDTGVLTEQQVIALANSQRGYNKALSEGVSTIERSIIATNKQAAALKKLNEIKKQQIATEKRYNDLVENFSEQHASSEEAAADKIRSATNEVIESYKGAGDALKNLAKLQSDSAAQIEKDSAKIFEALSLKGKDVEGGLDGIKEEIQKQFQDILSGDETKIKFKLSFFPEGDQQDAFAEIFRQLEELGARAQISGDAFANKFKELKGTRIIDKSDLINVQAFDSAVINGIDERLAAVQREIDKRILLGEITSGQGQVEFGEAQKAAMQERIDLLVQARQAQEQLFQAASKQEIGGVADNQSELLLEQIQLEKELLVLKEEQELAELAVAKAKVSQITLVKDFVANEQKAIDKIKQLNQQVQGGLIFADQAAAERTKLQQERQEDFEDALLKLQTLREAAADDGEKTFIDQLITDLTKANEETLPATISQIDQIRVVAANAASGPLTTMFEGLINGSKSASEAFKDFARSMIQNIVRMIAQMLALRAIALVTGIPVGAGGGFGVGANDGGLIPGRGPNKDTVPASLTRGEYVVRRSSVDKYGAGFFNAINSGTIPKASLQGMVSNASVRNVTGSFQGGGTVDSASDKRSQLTSQPVFVADDNSMNTMLSAGASGVVRFMKKNQAEINAALNVKE